MYPRAFRYYRAKSLQEATALLAELGTDAKVLAGGQSLIPLMKLRLSNPTNLVDLGFIPKLAYIEKESSRGNVLFGPMTRHAEIAASTACREIPILHDCAAGIADVQIRNMGTIGGSLAEADPTGDWAPVLLTLSAKLRLVGPRGERWISLPAFITDAFTTVLAADELISEVSIPVPPVRSGGAYIALKRCAQVYASASVAVQLEMQDNSTCKRAHIRLGAIGLTPTEVAEAETELRGKEVSNQNIGRAAEAASAIAQPQSDMRGSADYKRHVVGALTRQALQVALRRSRGESVEVSHQYA